MRDKILVMTTLGSVFPMVWECNNQTAYFNKSFKQQMEIALNFNESRDEDQGMLAIGIYEPYRQQKAQIHLPSALLVNNIEILDKPLILNHIHYHIEVEFTFLGKVIDIDFLDYISSIVTRPLLRASSDQFLKNMLQRIFVRKYGKYMQCNNEDIIYNYCLECDGAGVIESSCDGLENCKICCDTYKCICPICLGSGYA